MNRRLLRWAVLMAVVLGVSAALLTTSWRDPRAGRTTVDEPDGTRHLAEPVLRSPPSDGATATSKGSRVESRETRCFVLVSSAEDGSGMSGARLCLSLAGEPSPFTAPLDPAGTWDYLELLADARGLVAVQRDEVTDRFGPAPALQVTAQAAGHHAHSVQATWSELLEATQLEPYTMLLDRSQHVVRGTAIDEAGNPIPGVRVVGLAQVLEPELPGQEVRPPASIATTNNDGRFEMAVGDTPIRLYVLSPGWVSTEFLGALQEPHNERQFASSWGLIAEAGDDLTLSLRKVGVIALEFVGSDGPIQTGVGVVPTGGVMAFSRAPVLTSSGWVGTDVRTADAAGRFVAHVAPRPQVGSATGGATLGELVVEVASHGYAKRHVRASIQDPSSGTGIVIQRVKLESDHETRSQPLIVEVLSRQPAGSTIADCILSYRSPRWVVTQHRGELVSPYDGRSSRWRFYNLPADATGLACSDGYSTQTGLELPPGDSIDLQVEMPAPEGLVVTAVMADGRAPSGLGLLRVYPAGPRVSSLPGGTDSGSSAARTTHVPEMHLPVSSSPHGGALGRAQDGDARTAFFPLPAGDHLVRVLAPGCKPAARQVTIPVGSTTMLRVELESARDG